MRRVGAKAVFLIMALILPVIFADAQGPKKTSSVNVHRKEIPATKLPKKITSFISENLPHAKIDRAVKQRGNPNEKYQVYVTIKTMHHMLVFNNKSEFVRVVKSKKK